MSSAIDAMRAGGLGWSHQDPFDRMLVAQSLRYHLALATSDRVVIEAGIVSTLDTRAAVVSR